jgi:hypothetical protein
MTVLPKPAFANHLSAFQIFDIDAGLPTLYEQHSMLPVTSYSILIVCHALIKALISPFGVCWSMQEPRTEVLVRLTKIVSRCVNRG